MSYVQINEKFCKYASMVKINNIRWRPDVAMAIAKDLHAKSEVFEIKSAKIETEEVIKLTII